MSEIKTKTIASVREQELREKFFQTFQSSPIPDNEKLTNLGIFVKRQELTKILYLSDLYRQIVPVHGVIMEFGVRWGQNLVTLSNLRGIYEPYNYSRKIVGFDTFSGFEDTSVKDGTHKVIEKGGFSTTAGYEEYLEELMTYHQSESPLAHIRKFEIVKGNAVHTIGEYLNRHPETMIAMAYFDFDIYEPTVQCLRQILPYLSKGAVVAFDELTDPHFPGETVAFREVLGTQYKLRRASYAGIQSYIIYE